MEKLKRWDATLNQWVEVTTINRIQIMPPQEENSPKMLSAINVGGTQTEITFDKPLLPFDTDDNKDAFYVLAEWYWVQTAYPVTNLEQVSTTVIRLTHADISDADGLIRLGYNQNQGTVRGSNGYLVLSHFKSYMSVVDVIKLRFRDKFTNNHIVRNPINLDTNLTDSMSMIVNSVDFNQVSDTVTDQLNISILNKTVALTGMIDALNVGVFEL
jgi:hypothetical protein